MKRFKTIRDIIDYYKAMTDERLIANYFEHTLTMWNPINKVTDEYLLDEENYWVLTE